MLSVKASVLSIAKKRRIIKEGLVLHLDGRDFSNNPPTTLWKDRSPQGNDAVASNFGYILGDDKYHFEVEGNTLKNELTYNKNTYAEWLVSSPQITVKDTTGIELTSDNATFPNVSIPTNLVTSTKYGLLYTVVSCTLTDKFILDGKCFNYQQLPKLIGNNKSIQTSNSTITNNKFGVQLYNIEPIGNKIKFKEFRVYGLPVGSQIEADFINLTADQLIVKYPFASGIKSVGEDFGGVGVHGLLSLSRNTNLLNIYAITKRNTSSIVKVIGDSVTITDDFFCPVKVKVKPNTDYFIQAVRGGTGSGSLSVYTSSGICIKAMGLNNATFNSGNNTEVCVYLYSGGGVVATTTFSNVMLSEGTTTKSYVPYTESINSFVLDSPLRMVNNVFDKYAEGFVTRKTGKIVLNGNMNEDWHLDFPITSTHIGFFYVPPNFKPPIICDRFSYTLEGAMWKTRNADAVFTQGSIAINIAKSKLVTQDVTGFKAWLQANPTTVYYQLATPTTEVVAVSPLTQFDKGSLLVDSGVIPCKTNLLNYAPSGSNNQGAVIYDGIDDKITIPNSSTFIQMYKDGESIIPSSVISAKGSYKSIVAYNRVLTKEEIARNLKVLK
jgi:hypothetical protein